MSAVGARPTVHRTAAATVAASLARRRSAAERDAVELAERRELLSDRTVYNLTELLLVECEQRGIPVPEL